MIRTELVLEKFSELSPSFGMLYLSFSMSQKEKKFLLIMDTPQYH